MTHGPSVEATSFSSWWSCCLHCPIQALAGALAFHPQSWSSRWWAPSYRCGYVSASSVAATGELS